jgi:parvulin-like peptidyl-prolyl isomerase
MRFVKQALLGASLLTILMLSLTGCGRSVAKVNGEKISRQDYYNRLEKMPVTVNGQSQQAGAAVLQSLIDEKLKAQLARKEGVEPTKEQISKRIDQLKSNKSQQQLKTQGFSDEEIRDQIYSAQVNFNLVTKGVTVSDKECKDFYEKIKGRAFTSPAGAEMGLIVTNTPEKTERVRSLLKDKHQEFSSVALKNSDLEPLRRSRGVVGFVPENLNLVPADRRPPAILHKALFSLKPGEITDPIKSGKEWFTIKMIDYRKESVRPYAKVADQVREALMMQKAQEMYSGKGARSAASPDTKLRSFVKDAKVKVSIRRYNGMWEAMQKQMTARPAPAQPGAPVAAPAGSTSATGPTR